MLELLDVLELLDTEFELMDVADVAVLKEESLDVDRDVSDVSLLADCVVADDADDTDVALVAVLADLLDDELEDPDVAVEAVEPVAELLDVDRLDSVRDDRLLKDTLLVESVDRLLVDCVDGLLVDRVDRLDCVLTLEWLELETDETDDCDVADDVDCEDGEDEDVSSPNVYVNAVMVPGMVVMLALVAAVFSDSLP